VGVLSKIYVPFKNGQPNFSKVKSVTDFLISKGVNKLYANGIGAESLALSIEERKKC
jgi:dihydrodipicolinate synthase/N-acetylneuraminate lyase